MISNCIAHGHSSQQAKIHLRFGRKILTMRIDTKKTRTNKRPTKQFSNHLELLLCNKEEKKTLRKKTSGLLNDGKMEKNTQLNTLIFMKSDISLNLQTSIWFAFT